MNINWFPGHMHKAQKEIRQLLPEVDMVIEVIDARLPYSSQNPLLQSIRRDKPCIKLLNKSDLADAELTTQWINCLEQDETIRAYAVNSDQPNLVQQIPNWVRAMFPEREESKKPIQVMIMGIPNVGKSTIINAIAERNIAKTGNEAAVTKRQQRIKLRDNVILHDTPGVLWPKFDNQNSAFRLAFTGGIKDTVVDHEDVAFFGAEYLLKTYPDLLKERFDFDPLPHDEYDLLAKIGAKRGSLRAGGRVDLDKVSKIFINEYRTGQMGPMTLETPEMMDQDLAEVAKALAKKEAKKAARKESFQGQNKSSRNGKTKRKK